MNTTNLSKASYLQIIYKDDLILLSNGFESAWTKAEKNNLKRYYIKPNSVILLLDDKVMAEEIHENKSARSGGKISLKIGSDYDYKKGNVRDLANIKVAGEMGVGKIIKLIIEASKLTLTQPHTGVVKVV